MWVRACGCGVLGGWATAEFLSCGVLWLSWCCLVRAVSCSLSGKNGFYLCSLTLLARIFNFGKINLFFGGLMVVLKLVIFLRIFEVERVGFVGENGVVWWCGKRVKNVFLVFR